jgi:hypothetical protein
VSPFKAFPKKELVIIFNIIATIIFAFLIGLVVGVIFAFGMYIIKGIALIFGLTFDASDRVEIKVARVGFVIGALGYIIFILWLYSL